MQNEGEVEDFRFKAGIGFIRADETQKVFRSRKFGQRIVNIHAFVVVKTPLRLICVGGERRKARYEFDALTEHVCDLPSFRIGIVRIACEYAARHLVHDIARRRFHNHIFRKVRRKRTAESQKLRKFIELLLRRKRSEKQKVDTLFVAELLCTFGVFYKGSDIVTSVKELAGNRHLFAVYHIVTDDIADARKPDEHARPVCITQPALYVVLRV